MLTKNSNDTSWDRTSDLPICSTAHMYKNKNIYVYIREAEHVCPFAEEAVFCELAVL